MSRQPRQARVATSKTTKNASRIAGLTKSSNTITLGPSELIDALANVTRADQVLVEALSSHLKGGSESDLSDSSRGFSMKAVNAVLSGLSEVHRSGWTMEKPISPYGVQNVSSAALAAQKCLIFLRNSPSQSTERVALALVARLIAIQMFQEAWLLLCDIKAGLASLYNGQTTQSESVAVAIPLPLNQAAIEQDLALLVVTYLCYSLQVFLRLPKSVLPPRESLERLSDSVAKNQDGHLLQWILISKNKQTYKQYYTLCTSVLKAVEAKATTVDPKVWCLVRFYTVRCVLHVSGHDDISWVWKLLQNISASYMKAMAGDPVAFTRLHSDLVACVTIVQSRGELSNLFKESSFEVFQRQWRSLAMKANDTTAVQYVSNLSVSSPNNGSTGSASNFIDRISRFGLEMQACIEASNPETIKESISSVLRDIKSSTDIIPDINVIDDIRKYFRTVERYRRSTKPLYEKVAFRSLRNESRQVASYITKLYIAILEKDDLETQIRSEILAAILESSILSSKVALLITDTGTFDLAFDDLALASKMLDRYRLWGIEDSDKNRMQDLYRCLSGAFWNSGSQLYQVSRWDHAVPFITRSIDIDRSLLEVGARKRDDPVWKQFFEQMPKRLLVLASCFSKMSNRRRTYELNNEALRCLLTLHWQELELRSASLPSVKVLEDPKFELISATIDRITFLGSAELMLGKGTLLHPLVNDVGASPIVAGIILERQINALRDLWWKKEIQEVVFALITASEGCYASYPIRHARLLLIELEFSYYIRPSWNEAKQVGMKALNLLSENKCGQDESISQYKLQYRTSLHLWLACHAHIGQDLGSVRSHAESALEILLSFTSFTRTKENLAPSPSNKTDNTKPKPNAKGERKIPSAPPMNTSRIPQAPRVAQKKLPARKSAKTQDPSTPARVTAESLPAQPPPKQNGDIHELDDPRSFWALIEMALNLFGALGFLDLRLLYLDRCVNLLKAKGHVVSNDFYAKLLIRSAHEFARLGKVNHAMELYSKSLAIINDGTFDLQVKLIFLLRFASFLAHFGEDEKSLELYGEARDLVVDMEWDNHSSSNLERVQSRIRRHYYAAMACSTYADIQFRKNEPYSAWKGHMQALRLWHFAIELMQKFTVKQAPKVEEHNPFQMEDLAEALPEVGEPTAQTGSNNNPGPSGWNWVLAEGLFDTYLSLSKHQMNKGNYRDAEYFILQAQELANSLNATTCVVQALCFQAELALHLGRYNDSQDLLQKAERYSGQVVWLEAAEMLRVQGIYSESLKSDVDAGLLLTKAESKLRDFNEWIVSEVLSMTDGKAFDDSAPVLLNKILRHQVWLSRDGDYQSLLERIKELSSIIRAESDEKYIMAKLMAYQVQARLGSIVSSSSLNESVISLPFGVHATENRAKQSLKEAIDLLDSAKEYSRAAVSMLQHRGSVVNFRESVLTLVYILTLEEALRNDPISAASNVGFLIDLGAATTLSRELLENIESRLASTTKSDLEWPSCRDTQEPAHPSIVSQLSLFDPEADAFDRQGQKDCEYWSHIRTRYISEVPENASWTEVLEKIPDHWTIVSIGLAHTKDALLLSRGRVKRQPIVFRIPIGRTNRKENDDITGELSFETAKKELNDIIQSSAQNGKRAQQVANQGKAVRAEWWAERKNLDERLRTLLENIEFCWLGGFKAVLERQHTIPEKLLTSFYDRVYNIFRKHAFGNRKKGFLPTRLEETILECFAILPASCKDEELEDVIYYVLDAYQFRDHQVGLSDIAISEIVAELRASLEEFHKASKGKATPIHDHHLFLVLDRNLQDIPWESIPILRGQAVSRIPSMSFLLDRLELASMRQSEVSSSHHEQIVDRMPFNPAKVFYLLNPDGDLKGTETMLKSWLQSMGKVGWKGVINRKPSELEMHNALVGNDLFIYFGHGGAEQYIRGGKIRSLTRCASTMLWGCSSGAMQDAGEFDRTGTPYNYLLGGCPSLVVNLWDVTDKDIDRFAQSVFNKMHLDAATIETRGGEPSKDKMSVVAAVAESREICKLKYLTGAAPVVYGIPIYF